MDNILNSTVKKRLPEVKSALLGNLVTFAQYPQVPLLKAGDQYNGIWLEHNQDNLFLCEYAPESAWGSQEIFMSYQRQDGLLPYSFSLGYKQPGHPRCHTPCRYSQIQSVYPFARCALEIARKCRRPEADFNAVYQSASRYDNWFEKFRCSNPCGLPAMFCEYDTGHDNSPRVMDGGIPHCCPGDDAVNMPELPVMPIMSVDLAAMLYGHRIALAELAELLDRPQSEIDMWKIKAEKLRLAIKTYLYDEEDQFYYDRSPAGLRKYRTEHITRLFLNRVLEQDEFDRIFDRYFSAEGKEFATPFPMPSVSIDDPSFSCGSSNSWGGNTQCLTLLRALLYLDHYQRSDYKKMLLHKYLLAVHKNPASMFPQELHPLTGDTLGSGVYYTPALILFLEAAKEL